MFNQIFTPPSTAAVVKDTKDAWVIEMDMPGVKREQVEVNARGRILEIRGERQKGEGCRTSYRERFRLPDHLRSAEGVSAELNLGVLTVKVPKQNPDTLYIPVS
jgi:HSP20 family protein